MNVLLRASRKAAWAAAAGTLSGSGWYLYSNQHLLSGLPPVHSALQPGKSLTCAVREVEQLSHDTKRLRFGA
jgi:hypothetical protein